jgi:hypothetical protein
MNDDRVNALVQTYVAPYSVSGTQKPYEQNNQFYLEDRVRWLEMEVVRAGQTIEALCAVFQKVGIGK